MNDKVYIIDTIFYAFLVVVIIAFALKIWKEQADEEKARIRRINSIK